MLCPLLYDYSTIDLSHQRRPILLQGTDHFGLVCQGSPALGNQRYCNVFPELLDELIKVKAGHAFYYNVEVSLLPICCLISVKLLVECSQHSIHALNHF